MGEVERSGRTYVNHRGTTQVAAQQLLRTSMGTGLAQRKMPKIFPAEK